jgi:hypothetical protein
MKVIPPITLSDDAIISSNIIEDLPRGTSAVTYNKWSSSTAYSIGNQVCWTFTSTYGFNFSPSTGFSPNDWFASWSSFFTSTSTRYKKYPPGTYFGIFTAKQASTNMEPGKSQWTLGETTYPGNYHWTMNDVVPVYDAAVTFALGQTVGYINGSTGALYQSLVADNLAHTPSSSPTYWKQTTTDSYATWSSGTTYASGDLVVLVSGTIGSVYESLQNSNTNHAPATATTWWSYLGQAYKQYAAGTTYATGDVVCVLSQHHLYEALQGSTGKDPTDTANSAYWLDLGANNRWAMFDGSTTSRSSFGGEIDVTVKPGASFDSVALLNITATSVRIIATGYDETFDLTDSSFITDYRHYCFDPITYQADLIVNDIPVVADNSVRIIISNVSATASCGMVSIGLAETYGITLYGVTTGIMDFSRKEFNDFGDTVIVERPYSKRGKFRSVVPNTQIAAIQTRLAQLRATPVVYQGTDSYSNTWILGFFRDFSISLEHMEQSYLDIEIEGLT